MQFPQSLAVLSWTLYGIGIFFVLARLASRWIKAESWRGLKIEDYMMVVFAGTFTADMWAINTVAVNGSNYMSPEDAAALDAEGVARTILGSKMTLALEIFTLTTEWGCKLCLVILYHKLTAGLEKQPTVKLVGAFCLFSYLLITILLLTLWCHPIEEYWAVPVRHSQCATYYHHMIFATAFNIASDLMLLSIPIPIILRAQLPLKRKIVLVCILGLGLFNILTTVLNRYYNFSNPNSITYLNWYIGEVATSVIVTNVPLIWPLMRKVFGLNSWSAASSGSPTPPSGKTGLLGVYLVPRSLRRRRVSGDSTRALDCEREETLAPAATTSSHEGSAVQLTPMWHHSAHHASVSSDDKDPDIEIQVDEHRIVRTVEVMQHVK